MPPVYWSFQNFSILLCTWHFYVDIWHVSHLCLTKPNSWFSILPLPILFLLHSTPRKWIAPSLLIQLCISRPGVTLICDYFPHAPILSPIGCVTKRISKSKIFSLLLLSTSRPCVSHHYPTSGLHHSNLNMSPGFHIHLQAILHIEAKVIFLKMQIMGWG
jgi:hypothetical protein